MPRDHGRIARTAFLLFFVAVSSPARAQEPEKPTKVVADLGYVATSGNTEVTTVTGNEEVIHKVQRWTLGENAHAVWGETDGTETAGRYDAQLRADYGFTPRVSAYGLGVWRRNVFAGISRQFEEGAGVAWHAVVTKPNVLDLEAGAGLLQRRSTAETDDDFSTARMAALYQYHFTEKAYFEARGAYLLNLEDSEDSEANSRLALIAPLSGALSIKLGYDLYYRNKPLPGLESLDTTVSAGVQFAL